MDNWKLSQYCFAFFLVILGITCLSGSLSSEPIVVKNIKYAGLRSSSYGIKPFLAPKQWKNALDTMTGYFKEAQPVVIWNVGVIDSETKGVILEFPAPEGSYENIIFAGSDKHESYLDYFDANGIKVFLQVEPGSADVKNLIDLVLNRYSNHRSIAGFAIDVEWYHNDPRNRNGRTVTDREAVIWENQVKSHNGSFQLLLKHFDKSYLCPTYRGDIVFVDDSQHFENARQFISELSDFAAYFYPNPVIYQIGYPSDKSWWHQYNYPAKYLGDELAQKTETVMWCYLG